MSAPNMATITASLERSLQNCSLNHQSSGGEGGADVGERSSTSDDPPEKHGITDSDDTTLELNSHISLPHHWEQCLDLKTGEIYYINWSNGMKVREDPRRVAGELYSEESISSYDSEESWSESSPSSTTSRDQHYDQMEKEDNVLVVAGCKSCFMYYMVPKQVGDCSKCSGQLLHFDRSQNRS